jgi:inosine/xanthosine triphosphate pyrophosphatase family protein
MTLRLLAGTGNPAKAEHLYALCDGLTVDWIDATADRAPNVDETGATHIANAVRKAIAWSKAYAATALASDGGLVIPALGDDWQSLLTRRATGDSVSDEEHASRLLRRMAHLEGLQREAHWTEALAVARNGTLVQGWEAIGLHGLIAEDYRPQPTGPEGFWVSGLWTTSDGRRHWDLSEADLANAGDTWTRLGESLRGLLRKFPD